MSKKKTENSGERGSSGEAFSRAIDALRRGEVIVFPTETFYGLGADAFDAAAVERVVALKGRKPESPVSIIVAEKRMLEEVIEVIPPLAQRLIDHYWPGPLTLVLPGRKWLPGALLNSEGEVGVRISSHPLAARLVREFGHPLTATSANPSGKEPARTIEEAGSYFLGRLQIFLDAGRLAGTKGSTVVAVRDNQMITIREGEISSQELKAAVGDAHRPSKKSSASII